MAEQLKLRMYTIRDEKMGINFAPFVAQNDVEAMRRVGIMTLEQNSQIAHYPADYSLYHCGDFCTYTGILTAFDKLSFVETVKAIHTTIRSNANG